MSDGDTCPVVCIGYKPWLVNVFASGSSTIISFGLKAPRTYILGANWPTIDGNTSSGNPFNFGKIFGILRVTVENTTDYSGPSYIIVSGGEITELQKNWYIESWTINSSGELLIATTTFQHVFVTKIM